MSRVQLSLNVSDLDKAVDFYSKLFSAEPAKRRPGYANFAIAEPPLKLVLIEGHGDPGTLNHLGVEVDDADAVAAANARLTGAGLESAVEDQVACCFAVQDKDMGRCARRRAVGDLRGAVRHRDAGRRATPGGARLRRDVLRQRARVCRSLLLRDT